MCDTADYLPRNFRLSTDRTTLTLRKMCKRSIDAGQLGCSSEIDNGPMVIQCNASNEHGSIFANGYISVLGMCKTDPPRLMGLPSFSTLVCNS